MKDSKNSEHCTDELLARYLTGEAGTNEKKQVENWKNNSDVNHREFSESRIIIEKTALYYKTRPFDSQAAWENVRSKIKQQRPFTEVQSKKQIRIGFTPLLKYAAILIFVAVAGTMGYYLAFRNNPSSLMKIQATHQVLGEQILPDGTRVALNSNSAIYFPQNFTGNTREVTIEGEAFFEVMPDTKKPFIITAGKARIKVLGTSFNINAYPDKELVEVVVKTGSVQVSVHSGNTSDQVVILKPGEKGTLFNNDHLVKSVNPDPNFVSWKTRFLVFRETPLLEVIKSLEKIYPVEIQTSQASIDSLKLTAQFDDQPIDYVLEVIRLTFKLELKSENGIYAFTYSDN